RSLGALPREPSHRFVGRSRELLEAERRLVAERYVVLRGEGGEGKTTLAAELARWLVATRRFGRAAFASMERERDADALLFALGEQLVGEEFVRRAGGNRAEALKLVERALADDAVVIVVDNTETVLPPPSGEGAGAFEPEVLAKLLALCARLS